MPQIHYMKIALSKITFTVFHCDICHTDKLGSKSVALQESTTKTKAAQ